MSNLLRASSGYSIVESPKSQEVYYLTNSAIIAQIVYFRKNMTFASTLSKVCAVPDLYKNEVDTFIEERLYKLTLFGQTILTNPYDKIKAQGLKNSILKSFQLQLSKCLSEELNIYNYFIETTDNTVLHYGIPKTNYEREKFGVIPLYKNKDKPLYGYISLIIVTPPTDEKYIYGDIYSIVCRNEDVGKNKPNNPIFKDEALVCGKGTQEMIY